MPKEGITIAAPRNIPFGTVLEIESIGTRVVQDRTALKFNGRIDLYFESHESAKRFGKKTLRVRKLEKND